MGLGTCIKMSYRFRLRPTCGYGGLSVVETRLVGTLLVCKSLIARLCTGTLQAKGNITGKRNCA